MNRFDLAQPNNFQYMSTYVPLPLQEIGDLAKDYSNRYKQGKALNNQLGLLASKVQAAPMDYDLKNQFLQDSNKKMQSLVDKAKPEDWANPEFQDRMRSTLGEIVSDPRLNTIQSNKKWFDDEYTKFASNPKNAGDLDFTLQKDPNHSTGFKQNLQGKTYAGLKVTPQGDIYKAKSDIMSHINDSGYMKDLGINYGDSLRVGPNGEYQAYKGTKQGWVGISKDKVKKVANISADLYGNTPEGKYETQKILRDDLNMGDEAYNYDYRTLEKMANNGDKHAEVVFNHIKNKFGNDLFATGMKQIGGKSTQEIQDIQLSDKQKAYDIAHPKEDSTFDTLGSIEGNVSTTPIDDKTALTNLGIDSNLLDDKGDINYNSGTLVSKVGSLGFKGDTKENQQKANDYYSSLVSTAYNLGLDLKSYSTKGKIDYNKLKTDLIDISKNISKEAGNIQELQAGLKKDLSKNYFGEYTGGETDDFKISPLVQKMKIYENNNPETSENIDDAKKVKLAKRARFIGLDFNDPNLGSVAFTSIEGKGTEPKLYNGVLPDGRLKTLMKPVHQFTQDFKDASLGKITTDMSKRNVKNSSEILTALSNKILASKDTNAQEKVQKITDLTNSINNSNAKIIVGHNIKGDKLLIGTIKYENNKPIKTLIVVDIRTGIVDDTPSDLGKIQNEESSVIQRMIAPGFNPAAKGYENKEIDYEE